jgi:hypothetical protein
MVNEILRYAFLCHSIIDIKIESCYPLYSLAFYILISYRFTYKSRVTVPLNKNYFIMAPLLGRRQMLRIYFMPLGLFLGKKHATLLNKNQLLKR